VSRIDKLTKVMAEPELFQDLRVCLERTDDGHCGRCPKCLLNAFAVIAMTGEWPSWYPQGAFDVGHVAAMRPSETRRRYGHEILKLAAANGRDGEWCTALKTHLGVASQSETTKDSAQRQSMHNRSAFVAAPHSQLVDVETRDLPEPMRGARL
jgi:hypothetical protein